MCNSVTLLTFWLDVGRASGLWKYNCAISINTNTLALPFFGHYMDQRVLAGTPGGGTDD